jgi:hypothetical protein
MTRRSSILILVLAMLGTAIAAAPAAASGAHESINAITGSGEQGQPASSDSVNALVGADSSNQSPASSREINPSSLNATLGTDGLPQQSPQSVVEVREGDWFDGLIGALVASGLTLMTLAAARSVARHRRATAESRA